MESCTTCGGAIGEPGKAYGYAGKWCHCLAPKPDAWPHVTVSPGTVQDLWKTPPGPIITLPPPEPPITALAFVFWLRGYAAHGHVDPKILAELQKVAP